ncbi:MAG: SAM-dependent methyltransferase [Acidobacteria bacterium]|nr:MAG: SAM-dependent methyltransferase [Acidobacteriota bacterium]
MRAFRKTALVVAAFVLLAVSMGVIARIAHAQVPDVRFVATPPEVVDAMLTAARVTSADTVYDLGSGDGRIVIAAAQKYGARGVGIEINPLLVAESNASARAAGVSHLVQFIQGDLFTADIRAATVVTLYLSPSINERLKPRLLRELRPGARIVSHVYDMLGWTADQRVDVDGRWVFLWTVPPKK